MPTTPTNRPGQDDRSTSVAAAISRTLTEHAQDRATPPIDAPDPFWSEPCTFCGIRHGIACPECALATIVGDGTGRVWCTACAWEAPHADTPVSGHPYSCNCQID